MKLKIRLDKENDDYLLTCTSEIDGEIFGKQWGITTTTNNKLNHNKEILHLVSRSFEAILDDYEKSCKHI